MIAQELLDELVCPKCRGPIKLSPDGRALVCEAERLRYPVIDGLPLLDEEMAEVY
jgi:uncharacterized protein YbaR (Trm112 family)